MRDEAERRHGSILDLFLIFLFLLCIVGTILRWQALRRDTGSADSMRLLIVARSEAVDTRIADCLSAGEMLYTASGEAFGRVVTVTYRSAEVSLLSGGVYHIGAWPMEARCRVEAVIETVGVGQNGTWLREGKYPLSVGESMLLYGERSTWRFSVAQLIPSEG